MTKIYINYNLIYKTTLNDLDVTLKSLKKSIYDIGTISIPYDFEYAYYVKQLLSKNLDTYTKLKNRKLKITEILSSFKNIEKNNIYNIETIKNVNINKRKNIKG